MLTFGSSVIDVCFGMLCRRQESPMRYDVPLFESSAISASVPVGYKQSRKMFTCSSLIALNQFWHNESIETLLVQKLILS